MWGVKASVVPVVIGALKAVTPKLGEWLQHLPRINRDPSTEECYPMSPAKLLWTLRL